MGKVGIITFHSAYNFGSVLQAYATQVVINNYCKDVEIINYRIKEQRKIYSMYRTSYGIKTFIKDIFQLPVHVKRKKRVLNYENFMRDYYQLSKECTEPEEVIDLYSRYSVIVSGSDQIWNKHAIELARIDWKYMFPYLLKDYKGKKISYASSIANMTDDELSKIKDDINDFDYISMREQASAQRMTKYLNRNVQSVVDPTFLLSKEEWVDRLKLKSKAKRFILFYSLSGIGTYKKMKPVLTELAKRNDCDVKIIMPFFYAPDTHYLKSITDFGPCEFLEAIYNAKMVITDSYHGTILSVNFGKDVYSLCKEGGSEFRKTDILKRLGMGERIITDYTSLLSDFKPIDYKYVHERLAHYRQKSYDYLKKALSGE